MFLFLLVMVLLILTIYGIFFLSIAWIVLWILKQIFRLVCIAGLLLWIVLNITTLQMLIKPKPEDVFRKRDMLWFAFSVIVVVVNLNLLAYPLVGLLI